MNKQELQNEINKTKEHLANMEKMLAECDGQRWKPKEYQPYWFVNSRGQGVDTFFKSTMDNNIKRFENFNCFQTREQAEAEAEKILVRRMLEDIARRLNKGEKIDWDNTGQSKYFLGINAPYEVITWDTEYEYKRQGVVYCLDMAFRKVAIREIGEERLEKYLRGE